MEQIVTMSWQKFALVPSSVDLTGKRDNAGQVNKTGILPLVLRTYRIFQSRVQWRQNLVRSRSTYFRNTFAAFYSNISLEESHLKELHTG